MADQPKRAIVELGGIGHEHIEIDGHDLTKGVWSLDLTCRAGEIAELRLGLPLLRGLDLAGNAQVTVLPETHDALVALGWTPPPDVEVRRVTDTFVDGVRVSTSVNTEE
jgi:hypothetical protein